MKNKDKIIFTSLLILICIVIIIICSNKPGETKKETELTKDKIVENIIEDIYFNPSTTNEDIKKTVGTYLPRNEIFIGKDSILRKKPSSEIIKKYKLEEYEKMQNQYAEKVEKKYMDNTKYKIVESSEDNVLLEIVPWYYFQYTNDLAKIKNTIFDYADYDYTEKDIPHEEFEVNDYKARVIAMHIMDSYLDMYDNNTKERRMVKITYTDDKPGKADYFTLYVVLSGYTAQNGPSEELSANRADEYLNNAKKSGLFNEEKPYEIS